MNWLPAWVSTRASHVLLCAASVEWFTKQQIMALVTTSCAPTFQEGRVCVWKREGVLWGLAFLLFFFLFRPIWFSFPALVHLSFSSFIFNFLVPFFSFSHFLSSSPLFSLLSLFHIFSSFSLLYFLSFSCPSLLLPSSLPLAHFSLFSSSHFPFSSPIFNSSLLFSFHCLSLTPFFFSSFLTLLSSEVPLSFTLSLLISSCSPSFSRIIKAVKHKKRGKSLRRI